MIIQTSKVVLRAEKKEDSLNDDFPDETQDEFLQMADSHKYVSKLERKVKKLRENHVDRVLRHEQEQLTRYTGAENLIKELEEEWEVEPDKENENLIESDEQADDDRDEKVQNKVKQQENEGHSSDARIDSKMNDLSLDDSSEKAAASEEEEEEQFSGSFTMKKGMVKRAYDLNTGELKELPQPVSEGTNKEDKDDDEEGLSSHEEMSDEEEDDDSDYDEQVQYQSYYEEDEDDYEEEEEDYEGGILV